MALCVEASGRLKYFLKLIEYFASTSRSTQACKAERRAFPSSPCSVFTMLLDVEPHNSSVLNSRSRRLLLTTTSQLA